MGRAGRMSVKPLLDRVDEKASIQQTPRGRPGGRSRRVHQAIILIADDEPHITYMLSMKMERSGVRVLTASDGQQAYELACQHLPSLIITDFQMPLLSGFDMAVKLRENLQTTKIPLLMLTARGHLLSEADLARTNIRALIAKPFSPRTLESKVMELLAEVSRGDAGGPQRAGGMAEADAA
jgi:two-component system phosphate regulon response regulator PhoB